MRKVIVAPVVIGALGAVSENLKKVNVANWRESEFGSHPENSIGGDSKDTKKSTAPERRIKEERDLGPVVTCCNPLPRTINQAEYPASVYKEWTQ